MTRNIGTIDQVIRAILGLGLIAFVAKDPESSLAVLAGIYLFATAIFFYRAFYNLLSFTTFGRVDRSVSST